MKAFFFLSSNAFKAHTKGKRKRAITGPDAAAEAKLHFIMTLIALGLSTDVAPNIA